jgi:hypothetical protein
MRFSIHALAALVLAAGAAASADDLTIISKRTRNGAPLDNATSYVSSDHIRMSADTAEFIVDLKIVQMTTLDGVKKTYYVVTRQDMELLRTRIAERTNSPETKAAQEKMKNLPPEAQKKIEAMMGGATFDVRRAGTTRRVAGYNCENWTITTPMSKSDECVTSELQIPAQAWDLYRDFADTMKSMMSAMGPMGAKVAAMQERMKEMKGFPLAVSRSVNAVGHSSTYTSEVTEVKHGPIPASAWEIPAGYTKVDNPMLKSLQSSK